MMLGVTGFNVFAFQSLAWRDAKFKHIFLTRIHRQSNASDDNFRLALQDVRTGTMTDQVRRLLQQCDRPPMHCKGIPTELHGWNKDLNAKNKTQLDRLPGDMLTFAADDRVFVDVDLEGADFNSAEKALRQLLKQMDGRVEPELQFKIDAEVMLLKNQPGGFGLCKLVNGSRGKILRFDRDEDTDELLGAVVVFENGWQELITPVEFEAELSGRGKCIRTQLPLKLAWAMTVDKSQGATLEHVVVHLENVSRAGQAYVALSRAKSADGLQIVLGKRKHWKPCADELVKEFYDCIENDANDSDSTAVNAFLLTRAGLWWFPMLAPTVHPDWLSLFRGSSHTDASDQFSRWVRRHSPKPSLAEWHRSVPQSAAVSQQSFANSIAAAAQASPQQLLKMEENKRKAMAIRAKKAAERRLGA